MRRREFLQQAALVVGSLSASTASARASDTQLPLIPADWASVRDQFSLSRDHSSMRHHAK